MTVLDLILKNIDKRIELVCREKGPDGSLGFTARSTNQTRKEFITNYGEMRVSCYHTEMKYRGPILAPIPQEWIVAHVMY